jgi:hypothetical protein
LQRPEKNARIIFFFNLNSSNINLRQGLFNHSTFGQISPGETVALSLLFAPNPVYHVCIWENSNLPTPIATMEIVCLAVWFDPRGSSDFEFSRVSNSASLSYSLTLGDGQ